MPRYFFNVVDGRAYADSEGMELLNIKAAEREAIRTAGEIIRDDHFRGENWALEVLDEYRNVVLTLRFDAAGRPLHELGDRRS
jgi:hypothetical protein